MKKTILPKPDISKDAIHLSKYGYKVKSPEKIRRLSLKRASKKNNKLEILRRLNLIRNITKKNTETKRKLTRDVEFMKTLYKKEKKKSTKTKNKNKK